MKQTEAERHYYCYLARINGHKYGAALAAIAIEAVARAATEDWRQARVS